jgi:hypothetical protein
MVTEIKTYPKMRQPDSEVEAYRDEVPIEPVNVDLALAMPREILLGTLRDGRLRIISPLQLKLTYEGKHTIAEAVEVDEFGFGENISEAISDLQRTISELYFTLEQEQERLGVDLQRVWDILQKKILKR